MIAVTVCVLYLLLLYQARDHKVCLCTAVLRLYGCVSIDLLLGIDCNRTFARRFEAYSPDDAQLTGTIGFYACYIFVWKIFSAIKVD